MFCNLNGAPMSASLDPFEEGLRLFLARQHTPLEKLEVIDFRQSCFTASKTLYIFHDRKQQMAAKIADSATLGRNRIFYISMSESPM
ncbi:unnamed protein product [Symbiodinium sp. KB8]|nr:unnamed protein product [Symbiodinium sp. KB8]